VPDREKPVVTIFVNLFGFGFMKPFIVGWSGISSGAFVEFFNRWSLVLVVSLACNFGVASECGNPQAPQAGVIAAAAAGALDSDPDSDLGLNPDDGDIGGDTTKKQRRKKKKKPTDSDASEGCSSLNTNGVSLMSLLMVVTFSLQVWTRARRARLCKRRDR
jgi:hypothetical protein